MLALPQRRPDAHWTGDRPAPAVPTTNLDQLRALVHVKAEPQPEQARGVADTHRSVLGDCAVCGTTWPCDVVLEQLTVNPASS